MANPSVPVSPLVPPASPEAEGGFYALSPDDPAYLVFIDSLDYLSPEEVARVKAAVRFSDKAHEHQTRLSGEAYITHPLSVAGAVVEWRMDADAICAALLHDVLEDTGVTKAELKEHFGAGVADLVDGLSKLDKIEFASHQEAQAENFRKMLLAMARDLRVVLIKLADRHHNLQTMSAVRPDKRRRIARETLEIYAPIANRLGLNKMFRELQDTSFRLIHPVRAHVLGKAMLAARGHRKELLTRITDNIRAKIEEVGIQAQVFGREKSLYSIYTKMEEKRLSFSQILDIYGFRVVVHDIPTCYLALGALHALYKPVPGKFKDYIAIPKANGYQSLHTTLIGPYGTPVEVQIRTEEMDHVAQEGVASHWLYKDAEHSGADLQIRTHKWLQSLLEMQSGDSSEFFENVKIDLFPDEVYVFTPKGKILALPQGATPVDMAYAIHTDVGNCCIAARINHELAPLRTELKNGDVVEIVTAAHANPNPAWLSYVKTGRPGAKSAISCAPCKTRNPPPWVSACWSRNCTASGCRPRKFLPPPGSGWSRHPATARSRKSSPTSAWASASPPWPPAGCWPRMPFPSAPRRAASPSGAPKAWPSSLPNAASPSPATRSSAPSRRARAWWSTPTTVR